MKIGILGAGAMGSAIIKGLLRDFAASDLYVKGGRLAPVQALQQELGFNLMTSNEELIAAPIDLLFVVTPAKVTLAALQDLQALPSHVAIVSAVSGISLDDLSQLFPQSPIARIIPNTPVAVNAGTTGVAYGEKAATDKSAITTVLKTLGDVIEVPEGNLGILGTVGGCGPAFVDVFMEAMADAAVQNGLPRALAYQVVSSMVKGSAQLAFETPGNPANLKDAVTSPGGTTIQGVVALEKNGFRYAVIDAVNAANHN